MFTRGKGLTGFGLKYLALVAMVLDHIHYFFECTGNVPEWFSMVGRLAAPIFLFCLIEGFQKTRNQKKYFFRIYAVSVIMGLIRFGFYNVLSFAVRPDGFFPENAMLSSFVPLLVVLFGIQLIQRKDYAKGIMLVAIPILLPFLYIILFAVKNNTFQFFLNMASFSFLPAHMFISDGGMITLIEGLVLYLFRKNRVKQVLSYVVVAIVMDVIYQMCFGLSLHDIFTSAYEWLEIFSAIPILCYNGKRGKGSKGLFYFFYPLHIYILYGLSFLCFR